MSRASELIRQVAKENPQLAEDLRAEFDILAKRRSFGLNFERHVPESVELPGRAVRRGDKVRILPPRGKKPTEDNQSLWKVVETIPSEGSASIVPLQNDEGNAKNQSLADLVVVAEFRDAIYPGLVSTGSVKRGDDKPFHTIINSENYHALQALLYTHRGMIDAIYIDPPYNTRDKDWKYNNDYVDKDDIYKHSKWLAMMERRLLLAKELLNPDDSVLIVTIDEREYLRLGLLLEQLFPEARIQMITAVVKPAGVARGKEFARADEYIFYVFYGQAEVAPWIKNMLEEKSSSQRTQTIWRSVLRSGTNARREDRPNLFYPVFVDPTIERIVGVGESLPREQDREEIEAPGIGMDIVWPIRGDGSEGNWQIGPTAMRTGLEGGTVRLGSYSNNGRWTINYLREAEKRRIRDGEIVVVGKRDDGTQELAWSGEARKAVPVTVWSTASHDAGMGGTNLLRQLIPGRRFPFPKSLFAVEDSLRFVLAKKPESIVLDFFAGSGTTAHAVMRLNKQDGGRRQSISITNNEVSDEDRKKLRSEGLRPGDPAWEQLGICDLITKPRVKSAVNGQTPDGEPIVGDYKFTDQFPMAEGFEENVEFFQLTYEAPLAVKSHRDFERIAPLLWMRAGSVGRLISDVSSGWDVTDSYGVLADLDHVDQFLKEVRSKSSIEIAFLVTDEDRLFEVVARELPEGIEPVRLYESYLKNFEIETARSVR